MHKILCIGEALIDMICTDRGVSLADGQNFLKKPGGAPANVAAAIAALGGRADLAAKTGADPFGKHLAAVMQAFGVGTRWMLQDAAHFTTFAFVSLMENGERDFYFNRGADGQLTQQEVEGISLAEYGIVHFGSATGFLPGPLQDAYSGLLQKCLKDPDIFISFDPNYRHLLFQHQKQSFIDQSWNFLQACHFFKVSDEEALLLTGKDTVADAAAAFLSKTRAVFAITMGSEGAMLGINGAAHLVQSIPIKPVDTTGAGDAFVGALLYQLSLLDMPAIRSLAAGNWRQLAANANKAGARTCMYMGAMEAFKHLSNDIFS